MIRPFPRAVLLAAVVSLAIRPTAHSQPADSAPVDNSPVAVFRELLRMSPSELDAQLVRYPEPTRDRVQAKLAEYRILPSPILELRLAVTELWWYLRPLLDVPVAERAARLAAIPQPYRDLVEARLNQWRLTPPAITDNIIKFRADLWGFVGLDGANTNSVGETDPRLLEWKALPVAERRQMLAYFTNFIAMSDDDKDKVLGALSPPERLEAETKVDPIKTWSTNEMATYLSAFQKFSNMSAVERARFMKSAERWERMSEAERSAWREIVNHPPPSRPEVDPGRPADVPTPGGHADIRTNPTAARVP